MWEWLGWLTGVSPSDLTWKKEVAIVVLMLMVICFTWVGTRKV